MITYVLESCVDLNHQKEGVHEDIQFQCWEGIAWVVVVPHADLKRNYSCRVEEQETAQKEHHCQFRCKSRTKSTQ